MSCLLTAAVINYLLLLAAHNDGDLTTVLLTGLNAQLACEFGIDI